ncbi:MAG: hypothetical protein A3I66_11965 [Burkholderiales bacterium RIFCSPLOWO2_02_FULL_57_36]|nr:MAG: hypothetical protein A3I66_11965 [Burkholderiales bacterium RIFCSPLOWO2_02_FULL_57_36]
MFPVRRRDKAKLSLILLSAIVTVRISPILHRHFLSIAFMRVINAVRHVRAFDRFGQFSSCL